MTGSNLFTCRHCVVSLVSDGMKRYPIQRSSQWENETTRHTVSYCWQTSFIIWSHLSLTWEHTCFVGTVTVNRSPHRHSSRRWLEAPAGLFTKKLAATSRRRHWPICWCCLDRGPGSFDVENATTLSWSSAAVSEWVLTPPRATLQWPLQSLFTLSTLVLKLF